MEPLAIGVILITGGLALAGLAISVSLHRRLKDAETDIIRLTNGRQHDRAELAELEDLKAWAPKATEAISTLSDIVSKIVDKVTKNA